MHPQNNSSPVAGLKTSDTPKTTLNKAPNIVLTIDCPGRLKSVSIMASIYLILLAWNDGIRGGRLMGVQPDGLEGGWGLLFLAMRTVCKPSLQSNLASGSAHGKRPSVDIVV